jgi:predicted lipoprotein with Yx(FWY)xxD motif
MKYFESFPKTLYTFDKNTINVNAVTNIFARNNFLKEVANNVELSYEYLIVDEDTPDTLAHKAYGDPYRSWIILLFNNIINPHYDWPLRVAVLDKYIQNKYSMTLQETQTTVHHYEREIKTTSAYAGVILNETIESSRISEYSVNYTTNAIANQTVSLPTEADSSLIISSETATYPTYTVTILKKNKAVSIYTYEQEENEKRRKIRLLDPIYLDRVENEFRQLMTNG